MAALGLGEDIVEEDNEAEPVPQNSHRGANRTSVDKLN